MKTDLYKIVFADDSYIVVSEQNNNIVCSIFKGAVAEWFKNKIEKVKYSDVFRIGWDFYNKDIDREFSKSFTDYLETSSKMNLLIGLN